MQGCGRGCSLKRRLLSSEETPLCGKGVVDRWVGMQLSLQGPLLYVPLALMQQGELWACPVMDPCGTSAAYSQSPGVTESSGVGDHQGGGEGSA